jgi:hypothetical protein
MSHIHRTGDELRHDRNFNQPFLTPLDIVAGLVGAALIWVPLAVGGLFQ